MPDIYPVPQIAYIYLGVHQVMVWCDLFLNVAQPELKEKNNKRINDFFKKIHIINTGRCNSVFFI